VAIVFAVGALGGARMPVWAWVVSGLVAWVCALVFAAFGLFMGYLLPSENVMQILGPVLALLAFFGGLFVPLDLLGSAFQDIAKYTPAYGVGVLARAPLTGDAVSVGAVANVVVWTALFAAGAVWRFRRDTARV
jgi:ABC-2 type transport system permease protein